MRMNKMVRVNKMMIVKDEENDSKSNNGKR